MGLLNGVYPALLLSRGRPWYAMRPDPGISIQNPQRARVLLVAVQFGLTVMFLASALSLYAQLAMARAQSPGYEYRNLLYLNYQSPWTSLSTDAVVNTLRGLPGVSAAVPSVTVPPNMDLPLSVNSFKLVSEPGGVAEVLTTRLMVAEGFLDMLHIPLLAGRMLEAARDVPANEQELSAPTIERILLNRRASEALGFDSPESALNQNIYMRRGDDAGKLFDLPLLVVGVVEDNFYSSVRRRPVPEFYSLPPERYRTASQFILRYDPAVADEIQRRVVEVFEAHGVQVNLEFVESRIEAAFVEERNESRLLLAATGLALFLSCISLYGLAAATVARSVKEVGVRKVLGAGVTSLVGLFLWRFSRPILLANLIAWPLAGWLVLCLIQQFPYQIDLGWLPPLFLGASLLVLTVAWMTVGGLTLQAALSKPVRSLRYE